MTPPSLALLLAGALACGGAGVVAAGADDPPYRKPGEQPLEFRGPGRDAPEPDVDEVVLGWFGPGDPDHPEYGEFWRGASLALEQENAAGGYRGKPFRLEAAWSDSPWQAGVLAVTRLVYDRGAWAVIGGVDGATTHLAVQLALKSYFVLLSPGSTDVTADLANVPWLFSLPPSDQRLAPVLAGAIARAAAGGPFAIASANDHDSHAALVALRRALALRRLSPVSLVDLAADPSQAAAAAAHLLEAKPRAAVVLAGVQASAALVKALRAAGFEGPIVGGPATARQAFARAAGPLADRVVAPAWHDAGSPAWSAFARDFAGRWHGEPDWAAAAGYDSVRLLASALRTSGLNRARLRDAVRSLSPTAGAGGEIRWDPRGRNEPPVRVEVWRDGRLVSRGPDGPP